MRNLTLTLLLLLTGSFIGNAQTVLFLDDFETVPSPNTTSSGSPGWFTNTRLQVSGLNCDSSNIVAPLSVSDLTTTPFSTMGNSYVTLTFQGICKADFFDAGIIEVSIDGGASWNQLIDNDGNPGGQNNCNYLGAGNFRFQGSKFQEVNYSAWAPGNPIVPDNSWWQAEEFDISALTGNQPDVRLRFRFYDNNGDGAAGRTGWYLDDVKVVGAVCELIPPTLTQDAPFYPTNIYNLGPYTVNATATDLSGLLSVTLYYSVNGGTFTAVPMTNTTGNSYTAIIPAVNDLDQICYYIEAIDNSGCNNTSYSPGPTSANTVCFTANQGITFPYCDYFDIPGIPWSGSGAVAGTVWQLGPPASGVLNSAYSPPNAWVTNLTAQYGPNANAALVTPEMSFTVGAGATLEFWQNRNTEAGWDGTRLQWATNVNGPWTTLGSLGCAGCVNWYTDAALNTDNQPGWEGTSGGWVKSSILLDATFNNLPQVWFRFLFVSDGVVQADGMAIDNFCIFLPEPDDVGVISIDAPASSSPAGTCADVVVTVKNHGINPQTNFPVYYLTSFGATGTANYTGPPITPGATAQVTLPCFTVPVGNFSICAWTELTNDGNHFNDTTCANSFGTPIYSVSQGNPYFDNFNTGATGWSGQNPTGAPLTQWELGAPTFGATNSSYSPPNCWDVNLNTAYGGNASCELLSPLFDFSQAVNPFMNFWINHNCESGWDGTRLEYRIGNTPWTLLGGANLTPPCWVNWYNSNPTIISSNLPAWHATSTGWTKVEALCLPAAFNNQAQPVQFRFVFTSDGSVNTDGFSIDDFTIALPEPDDVGVVSIDQPTGSSPANSSMDVIVTVKNHGTNPQTTFPVTFVVSPGGQTNTVNFSGNLLPGTTSQVTIPGLTVPPGGYTICTYTGLATDANHFNDTLCGVSVGIPVIAVTYTAPYVDDFNGVNIGWSTANPSGAPITQWQLGSPTFGATSSCFSPPNCWDVNLTTAYGSSAACELLSPMFDFSQAVDAKLSFWRNHNCESGWDGTRLDYRIGNGNWTMLGAANLTAPCWVNWYNSTPNINATTQPAWMGASGGWVKAEATCLPAIFNNQPSPVQFRFLFASDPSVQQDGFSIDDFEINIPVPLTAAPIVVNTNAINNSFIFPGQPVQFSSPISNPGTTPLTSVIATVKIDGVYFTSDTIYYSPALPSAQNLLHTFLQNWNAAPGVYEVCVITSEPNFGTDLNPFDDTTCITISVFDTVSITTGNSFCTDFETGPQWVSANAVTLNSSLCSWQLGTPAQTLINSAASGQNAWMTQLAADYPSRDTSALFTPVFAIDTTKCYRISFNHIYKTEAFQDGGILEFSNDYAVSWHHVGVTSANNPAWYNTAFVTALGGTPPLPGWSGTQNTWKLATQDFQFWGSNTIMLRFRFASDNTVNSEGWAIDDFCLEEIPGFCVVSVPEVIGDGLILGQNQPNPFSESTAIHFALPTAGQTKLYVTDVLGREVMSLVDDRLESGTHSFDINGKTLNAGIYYYTLEFDGHEITRKMVLTR